MKNFLYLFFFLLLLVSCTKDSNTNNQYLNTISFSYDINKNLPAYSVLEYPGNPVLIQSPGVGIQGVIVMKTGNGNSYIAWEASCPNQYPTACSKLEIKGVNAICGCDQVAYNLYTGSGEQTYPLKPYRVEVIGDIIRIFN